MRCKCCNSMLSDYEATMRHGVTNEYLDTCTDCLATILEDVPLVIHDNRDLLVSQENNTWDDDPDVDLDTWK